MMNYNINTSVNAPLMENQAYQGVSPISTVPIVPTVPTVPTQEVYSAPVAVPVAAPAVAPVENAPVSTPVSMPSSASVDPASPLNYLAQFPCVRIVENINMWQVMTDYNAAKKFAVFLVNDENQEVPITQTPFINAIEDSECCQRMMCGVNREFHMNLIGPDGNLMVQLHRPFTCQFYCLNTPEMHILDSNGQSCGCIKNHFNCIDHNFSITDHTGMECLTVSGSGCQPGALCFAPWGPCSEMVFEVVNNRTGTTGTIKRKWDSWARQLFTNADTFTITFPEGSTIHERLLLFGATFLLNMMLFENSKHHDSGSGIDFSSD